MDLEAIHKRLGQKLRIASMGVAITGYTVRTGNWVTYELSYESNGQIFVGHLTAQALADLEERIKEPNVNWQAWGPFTT